MPTTQRDIVAGLLLHIGGLSQADEATRNRVAESINPIYADLGLWQAQDGMLGLSWIVALGYDQIHHLAATRHDGECWQEYKPSTAAVISEVNSDEYMEVRAVVASFHDSRHGASPPALLRIDDNYVYRNLSGHSVLLSSDLAMDILEMNKLPA